MTSANVELIQSIYANFIRRDQAAIAALIAPDVRITQSTALPWGGSYTGHAGLKQFFATLMSHVDSRVEFERYVDAGNYVAAVGWVKGTVRANGKAFEIPVVHLWEIRDGKAVAFNPYIENALMVEALKG